MHSQSNSESKTSPKSGSHFQASSSDQAMTVPGIGSLHAAVYLDDVARHAAAILRYNHHGDLDSGLPGSIGAPGLAAGAPARKIRRTRNVDDAASAGRDGSGHHP
ncbi:hypothetical protein BQ8794_410013 [Mesorhizobium prunaredense]|uniref:Uncharacterized protein n=1 Tax=Mesorhizobium prunaredense TaxID=1631249 RepID=A0A1R3VHF3_9HYPH|nr:hypothetical protein BQ8794_410013 [Mesorhizobium prunaredense]